MGRYHPSYREMQAAMEETVDQVVEDRLREALGVNETVPLVDACEQLRRERDDAVETMRMEMAENLRLFDMLGLSKADDFGNDDSTTAVAKKVQLLLSRLTRLRDAAKWVVDDAYYTAPELVVEKSREVWIPKLNAAIAESEGP